MDNETQRLQLTKQLAELTEQRAKQEESHSSYNLDKEDLLEFENILLKERVLSLEMDSMRLKVAAAKNRYHKHLAAKYDIDSTKNNISVDPKLKKLLVSAK